MHLNGVVLCPASNQKQLSLLPFLW